MKTVKTVSEAREAVQTMRQEAGKIGFVPTMGYLHEGHLSLVRKSMEECGGTVVSIFVNPMQFGPSEDYARYPRDAARDADLLGKAGVDLLFMPAVEEMYEKKFFTSVEVSELSRRFEGSLRPGHFKGVCTVVCKLFNIVSPDRAYFGWKDAQQLLIIKKMARDLNIPVEIISCPTSREDDGLAISSRNIYIPADRRRDAAALYKGLSKVRDLIEQQGVRNTSVLEEEGKKTIRKYQGIELQYFEIVDPEDLSPVKEINGKVLVLGAVRIDGVRLIDNMLVG